MKKPASLRDLLLRAVPALRDDPALLAIYVDKGQVAARAGKSLSFEYRYKLNLVVQDYSGDRNLVVVPILAWIAQNQPDLLQAPSSIPIEFESEILDAETCDLSFTLNLTERVTVQAREGGGYEVRNLDEEGDPDRFPGLCDTLLWQLILGDRVIAQTSDPRFQP